MAIVGTQIASEWFKPYDDDPAEYNIRPLDNVEYANVFVKHSDVTGVVDGSGLLIAFLAGVGEWKQVFDSDGKSADINSVNVSNLERKHFYRVANRVIDISALEADEIKNL